MGKQWQTLFFWAPKSLQMVTLAMKLKDACPWKKSYDQCRQCIKKQRHKKNKNKIKSRDITLLTKVHIVKAIVFPVMHELDHKEGWALKNWCFWTVVLEKTLESPLDCKEIKPELILKEINPEYSVEGLILKLKLQYFGYLMRRVNSMEKTLMLGKTEGRKKWTSLTQWTWVWANSGT